jgi:hypothetical protein
MTRLLGGLPYNLLYQNVLQLSSQITFGYTNVPGPSTEFDWGIVKVHKITPVGSAVGNLCNIFTVLTLNGKASFTLSTCKGYIDYPDEFITTFKKHLD